VLGCALGLALGCSSRSAFPCASSSQCVAGGQQGTCADGFCAFPDPNCPGGMRYEANAGDGLGGSCLPAPPDAALPCGEAGQACCAEGAGCMDQMFCNSGTCASCLTDLAFGRRFSCVLEHDRSVRCSGANVKGQLGFGIAGVASATRMQVRDAASGPLTDATAIGVGRDHACAVRAGGSVWCWGANERGQLGNNAPLAPAPAPQPAAVAVVMAGGLPLTGIVQVGGGYDFTCARDGGGGVWCWGNNGSGTLGDGTTTMRSTAARVLDAPMGQPLTGALDLQVGASVACVRKAGDAVWCWGQNNSGQFGDTTQTNHPSPVLLATTTSLALGMWHTCYVEADGAITCSGWNGHGRLGLGTGAGYSDGNHLVKEKVLSVVGGPPFTGAAAVVAAGVTCALMKDARVFCWGDDHYGQTGTGRGVAIPTEVRGADGKPLTGVERLIAGYTHVCALKATGELLCWGRNTDGDLGDGVFANRGFPSPIESTCR
jgi:alpha-tubulin suppressor-like RCC1 family protein